MRAVRDILSRNFGWRSVRQDAEHCTLEACAPQMSEDLLTLFRKTGALLDGHFVLRSGLHSRQYFQCAILHQHTEIAAGVCGALADKSRAFECDTVISPSPWGDHHRSGSRPLVGQAAYICRKGRGETRLAPRFQDRPSGKVYRRRGRGYAWRTCQETIDIVRANGEPLPPWE